MTDAVRLQITKYQWEKMRGNGASSRDGKRQMRLLQHGLEEASRIGGLALGDRFRRTGNEDLSAAASAFRPKVNDPVSRLDDIQLSQMFYPLMKS